MQPRILAIAALAACAIAVPVTAAQASASRSSVTHPAAGSGAFDVTGSISGRRNQSRTTITGTWSLKIVTYDPADPTGTTVKDTCDSGKVKYTAKN